MKIISITKERLLFFFYTVIIAVGIMVSNGQEVVPTFSAPLAGKIVLLDAGHGGWDPGKVSADGVLEKEINLQVMQKLQMYLEQGGAYVLDTRVTDEALGGKKQTDLRERRNLIDEGKEDLFVSIHQNAYPQENVKGAQVFYYADSDGGKRLAEYIQSQLKSFAQPYNNRVAKADSSIYILKKTSIPAVIVECGFLSNLMEKENLSSAEYQERLAWAIYLGILDYCKSEKI